MPVLRDDSHPKHHHLCPMHLPIARRCSTSVQTAFLQCGETWGERRGSHRVSPVEGRLGSSQTVRAESHLWPLLGDPTVSRRGPLLTICQCPAPELAAVKQAPAHSSDGNGGCWEMEGKPPPPHSGKHCEGGDDKVILSRSQLWPSLWGQTVISSSRVTATTLQELGNLGG